MLDGTLCKFSRLSHLIVDTDDQVLAVKIIDPAIFDGAAYPGAVVSRGFADSQLPNSLAEGAEFFDIWNFGAYPTGTAQSELAS